MQNLALSKHLMNISIMIIVTILLIVINTQYRIILIIYSYVQYFGHLMQRVDSLEKTVCTYKYIIINIITSHISYFNFY